LKSPKIVHIALGSNEGERFEILQNAVNKIFECSRKHNIAAGIQTGSVAYTKRYLDQGFHMVTLGGDSGFMARMARQELKAARQGSDVEKVDPESGFY